MTWLKCEMFNGYNMSFCFPDKIYRMESNGESSCQERLKDTQGNVLPRSQMGLRIETCFSMFSRVPRGVSLKHKSVKPCVPQSVFNGCLTRESQKNTLNHLDQSLTRVFGKSVNILRTFASGVSSSSVLQQIVAEGFSQE